MSVKSRWEQYKEKNGTTPLDLLNPNTIKSSPELIQQRLSICNSCERFFHPTKQCKECGCFMEIKTKLQESICPLRKW